jgi:uncharacterized membrane protein
VPEHERERDLDRELIELLNELRVVLPGVQVLFAFLLVLPFQQRFERLGDGDRDVYFAGFLCTATASALLIAPSAYHRLRWREGDKEHMLETANRLAIAGSFFLAAAIVCTVYLITDVLFSSGFAIAAAVGAAVLYGWLWYGLALARRLRDR